MKEKLDYDFMTEPSLFILLFKVVRGGMQGLKATRRVPGSCGVNKGGGREDERLVWIVSVRLGWLALVPLGPFGPFPFLSCPWSIACNFPLGFPFAGDFPPLPWSCGTCPGGEELGLANGTYSGGFDPPGVHSLGLGR